jgi:hypothetical protein
MFETGASRDDETGKLDYDGSFSPEVLRAFAIYMDFHRHLPDGTTRATDDWKRGIPIDVYMKSGSRHFMDWWLAHHEYETSDGRLWSLLGLLFNVQGYIHEYIKQHPAAFPLTLSAAYARRDSKAKGKC